MRLLLGKIKALEEYKANNSFILKVAKWTIIGLLVRIIIMPFSMDADMLWINYLPHKLVAHGNWDIYTFAKNNFAGRVLETRNPYYPPLTFYLLALFQFISQKLLPTLQNWFLQYEVWLKGGGGYTLGHVDFSANEQLFRILFFLKLPLLFFDFGIGFMLLRLASDIKRALFVFRLWMLNPVVLHSAYASGQIDIYPTFFVVLAVLLGLYKRPYLAVLSLSLGILLKCYPVILLPVALFYFGKTPKDILKLSIAAILPITLFYLPTLITSKGYSMVSIFPGGTIGTSSANINLIIMKFCFLLSLIFILIHIHQQQKNGNLQFSFENYCFLVLLLFFAFQPIGLRFYIWIMPFLFLQFTKDPQLFKLSLVQLLTLVELRQNSRALWFGLFAPLHPEFFNSLPIPDSFIAPFINVIYIHKLMYRLFIVITLYMVYRTAKQIKLHTYTYGR